MTYFNSYPDVSQLLPHEGHMKLLESITFYNSEILQVRTKVDSSSIFFDGHFPGYPILPGVILVEMMYQACGLFGGLGHLIEQNNLNGHIEYSNGMVARSIGIDKLRFQKPVFPEEELLIEVKPLKKVMSFAIYQGIITKIKDESVVVNGELTVFMGKSIIDG